MHTFYPTSALPIPTHYSTTSISKPTPQKLSPSVDTLADLVSALRQELGSSGIDSESVEVARIQSLLDAYKSNPADWQKYAFFSSRRYTRNLIDAGNGKYNLILLCWDNDQSSPVHDHANAHCLMKVMDGELLETQYNWPKEGQSECELTPKKQTLLMLNETTYIHDKIGLHKVQNPCTTKRAVSLHLYSPPIEFCRTFCEKSGYGRPSGKCTFHSVEGELTNISSSCLNLNAESK